MNISFVPVETPEQIARLAALAREIWTEHFTPIIGAAQVEYMLEKFQSAPALQAQLAQQGYRYYFLAAQGREIGYTGIRPDGEKLFLSKLYLRREERKKGYASQTFEFLEKLCRENGWRAIWLTVNRHNDDTVAVYRARGFSVVREQAADIGGGFVMDDYIMEKPVANETEGEKKA